MRKLALILALLGSINAKTIKAGTLLTGISTLDIITHQTTEVKAIRFRKTPEIITAVSKGEVDVAVIPVDMAAKLYQAGVKINIIAVDMFQNQAILTMKPDVKSIYDLKGKTVAALVASGTFKMFKSYMKLTARLEVGKDFKVLNAAPGAFPDILKRGDADAVVAWEPLVSIMINQRTRVVSSFKALWQKLGYKGSPVMLVWITSPKFKDTTAIRKFVALRKTAAKYWVSNPDSTVEILKKIYNFSIPVARSIYERTEIYDGDMDESIIENIRRVWQISWKGGYLKKNPVKIPDTIFYH